MIIILQCKIKSAKIEIPFRLGKLREDKSEVTYNMKKELELARQREWGGRNIERRENIILLDLGKSFKDLKSKNIVGKQKKRQCRRPEKLAGANPCKAL